MKTEIVSSATKKDIQIQKSKTIETVLHLLGNGEIFPTMELSNGVQFNRNFDYCAAYIENDAQKETFKNFALQLGFTQSLGEKNGMYMFKIPYENMVHKEKDTKIFAKEHGLKQVNTFEDVKGNFYNNENIEIERYTKELYKKGFASYSEPFNDAMLAKFPNSSNTKIQNILKLREIKAKHAQKK